VGPSVLLSARWAWADTHRSYVCLYIVLSKCRHGTVYTNPLLYIHIDSHDLVLKDYISKGAHARVCTCARTRERDWLVGVDGKDYKNITALPADYGTIPQGTRLGYKARGAPTPL
jgi:hypothetical protein